MILTRLNLRLIGDQFIRSLYVCREPTEASHLPHEVVVLVEVHVLRIKDTASERTHLSPGFDPRLGENTQAFSRDGALSDDHFTGQHQAGQLLNL